MQALEGLQNVSKGTRGRVEDQPQGQIYILRDRQNVWDGPHRETHMPPQSGRLREGLIVGTPRWPALEALLELSDHCWPGKRAEGSISGEVKTPI